VTSETEHLTAVRVGKCRGGLTAKDEEDKVRLRNWLLSLE
jgi:hypothetical protein